MSITLRENVKSYFTKGHKSQQNGTETNSVSEQSETRRKSEKPLAIHSTCERLFFLFSAGKILNIMLSDNIIKLFFSKKSLLSILNTNSRALIGHILNGFIFILFYKAVSSQLFKYWNSCFKLVFACLHTLAILSWRPWRCYPVLLGWIEVTNFFLNIWFVQKHTEVW